MCLQVPLRQGVRDFTREILWGYDISLRYPSVINLRGRVKQTGWITSNDFEGSPRPKNAPTLFHCAVLGIVGRVSVRSLSTYGHRDILSHQTNDMLGTLFSPLPPSRGVLLDFPSPLSSDSRGFIPIPMRPCYFHRWKLTKCRLLNICLTHSKTCILLTGRPPQLSIPLYCISSWVSLRYLLTDFKNTNHIANIFCSQSMNLLKCLSISNSFSPKE